MRTERATRRPAGSTSSDSRDLTCELAALPNLGPRSAQMLVAAGIGSPAQLRRLGSVTAYLRVQRQGARPSLNLLWALEGAISGLPWQQVAREHRTSLLLALESAQAEIKG